MLFLYLILKTRFPGKDYIGNVEIFFHFDPLLALTTLIASRALFLAFAFSAITLVITLVLGRVVCGWVCPLGAFYQFFSFVFKKSKLLRPKKTPPNSTLWKYYILVLVFICALFSLDLVGILDPLSLLYRSFTTAVLPLVDYLFSGIMDITYKLNLSGLGQIMFRFYSSLDLNSIFIQGFFLGLIFLGIVLLNLYRERFWCRYLCPLGALLGVAARWNLFKLKIDSQKCIHCHLCSIHCPTQAAPFPEEEWKSCECVYCFTCSSICPTGAVQFPVRTSSEPVESINLSRRKLLFTSVMSLFVFPLFRLSPTTERASPKLIRPPGALRENKFLQKCVKCGECLKVCPTNALQPVLSEGGPEALWTPRMVPRIGYCEYYCSLCSQVCPTGAIQELSVEEKTQVTIGTAWIDKNRCIPYTLGAPCIVCEEHCPTSPKAIKLVKKEIKLPDGTIKSPAAPVVDLEQCIGCGICENKCPVVDQPAIYITSVGESRSEKNQLLLDIILSPENPYH